MMKKIHKMVFISSLTAIAGGAVAPAVFAAGISVSPAAPSGAAATFIYSDATAKPMPLPMAKTAPAAMSAYAVSPFSGPPGFQVGALGSGVMSPVNLGTSGASAQDMASPLMVSPQEFGTSNHPFTTAPVDLVGTPANAVSLRYPYRATGKLYFKKPNGASYVCSASLIKKGLIVTAAHCVTKYGGTLPRWYNSWQFVPAKYDGLAPYGIWNASIARVMSVYYNGTDSCAAGAPGVVCRNDIAILTVTPKSGVYPGKTTGWYGWGYNGYGFSGTNLALINQLGYPASHNSGNRMQRTDSQGFISAANVNNTVWGSRQTGGSSGGPELVNLSPIPGATLSGGILLGAEPQADTVVGVTSWGYTNQAVKQQGASAFTNTNILALVNAACAATPAACAP
ncbi:MAG: hypothetical protein A2143_02050 [Gallionellales bacterium RBG_16_57_15]|nr:MAG: hypothetical protein A2143_02050 [Gallionellales bacterium RBG_16_57_15]